MHLQFLFVCFKCGEMYVERGDGRFACGDSEWEGVVKRGGREVGRGRLRG